MSFNEKVLQASPAQTSLLSVHAGMGKPKAVDLSHHLSELSKAREVSPLKGLAKYFNTPGLISLAGGTPSPEYFPFASVSAEALVPTSFALSPSPSSESNLSWFWRIFSSKKEQTEHLSVPKYTSDSPNDTVALDTALQYGTAQGIVPLQNFMQQFTAKVYNPQYSDFTTLIHAGNTDAWCKAVQTLCNPGEAFLTEEWTYPSAIATATPLGVHPVSVKIDGEGMRSDDLRKLLAEWDETARGAKRPHVMYTVPIGQNPTGATMGATRKREIYNVCVEFDVIIVEDDPYFFLQQAPYVPKMARKYGYKSSLEASDDQTFIDSLAPSFLKFDYEGRVIRCDSFSKTIAPGSRLGWYTCNERFAERLERQGETSTQAPCGFGQAIVAQLLTKRWGFSGYVRWLRGLRTEYTQRRDLFIDGFYEHFDLDQVYVAQGAWAGCTALVAQKKHLRKGEEESEKFAVSNESKTLFSFVPPTAGMFLWLKIHFYNHPKYLAQGPKANLEERLFEKIAEAGVLVGPGRFFAAVDDVQNSAEGHLRMSFSYASPEDMKKAVNIISKQIIGFFEEK